MKIFKSLTVYLVIVTVLVGAGRWMSGKHVFDPAVYSTCDEPPSDNDNDAD